MDRKRWIVPATLLFLLMAAHVHGQTTPPLPGVVSDVRTINTTSLLNIMSTGNSQFVPIGAHRGYWRYLPESSIPAITGAYDLGIEAVEIDVRYVTTTADPFTDPNALLVLSHDECADRETTGSGSLRYNPNPNKDPAKRCTGGATGFSGSAYTSLQLRDRHGAVTTYHPPTFAQSLQALNQYQANSNGTLTGPLLIVDLKDKDRTVGGFEAWNEYLQCLSVMRATLPPEYFPSVLFKLKMDVQPSPSTIKAELDAHPNYGHLIETILPEDVTDPTYAPSGSSPTVFNPTDCSASSPCHLGLSQSLPPYIQQFELVPYNPNDGTSAYQGGGTSPATLSSFATYYQPSTQPEGVTDRFAHCCALAPLIISETKTQSIHDVDVRGILDFAVCYSQVGMITSDNLVETLNFLQTKGQRNVKLIAP